MGVIPPVRDPKVLQRGSRLLGALAINRSCTRSLRSLMGWPQCNVPLRARQPIQTIERSDRKTLCYSEPLTEVQYLGWACRWREGDRASLQVVVPPGSRLCRITSKGAIIAFSVTDTLQRAPDYRCGSLHHAFATGSASYELANAAWPSEAQMVQVRSPQLQWNSEFLERMRTAGDPSAQNAQYRVDNHGG
jgi:hypothetical protein